MSQAAHAHPNYVKVWALLVLLLVVSVCGPMLGIPAVTIITAFGIAVVKAYLVAKNFMHLNIERGYVVLLLVAMIGLMVLLFGGVAPDVMRHEGRQWENTAAQAEVARALGIEAPRQEKKRARVAKAVLPPTPEENFLGTCAPCHGERGAGNGPAAAALNPRPANFTDPEFWKTRDRAHIEKVIREGGPAVGKSPLMAPFGGRFSAEELGGLVDHVMKMRP